MAAPVAAGDGRAIDRARNAWPGWLLDQKKTIKDQERFGGGREGALRIFKYAASLGHSHSLTLHCDTGDLQRTTFKRDEAALKRYRAFAGDGFFRLSIGLEDADDLCQDRKRALDAAA